MASQSIQRRIDLLLDEANKAVAESNWAVVLNCAEHVLRMNTENEPARAFMAAASDPSDAPDFPSSRWTLKTPGRLPVLRLDETEPPSELVDSCAYFVTLEVSDFANVELFEMSAKMSPWKEDGNSPLLDGMQNISVFPESPTIRIQTPNEDWSPRGNSASKEKTERTDRLTGDLCALLGK